MRGTLHSLVVCTLSAVCVTSPLGCTAIVVGDLLEDSAPCTKAVDCAAGFVCSEGVCEASGDPGVAPPPGLPVDERGGSITGPDGVILTLPPGAVSGTVHVQIEKASSTIVPTGVDDVTPLYEITPLVILTEPATFSIPIEGACDGCALFQEPDEDGEPWIALEPPAVAPAGTVSGSLDRLGDVLVAGREAP